MPFLFGTPDLVEEEEKQISDEEIEEEDEQSQSEEEESEEEDAEPAEGEGDSFASIPEFVKIQAEERLEFHRQAREIFINEWLNTPGNWLSELDKQHLDFLRDIMGVETNYAPSAWPAYTGSWRN